MVNAVLKLAVNTGASARSGLGCQLAAVRSAGALLYILGVPLTGQYPGEYETHLHSYQGNTSQVFNTEVIDNLAAERDAMASQMLKVAQEPVHMPVPPDMAGGTPSDHKVQGSDTGGITPPPSTGCAVRVADGQPSSCRAT